MKTTKNTKPQAAKATTTVTKLAATINELPTAAQVKAAKLAQATYPVPAPSAAERRAAKGAEILAARDAAVLKTLGTKAGKKTMKAVVAEIVAAAPAPAPVKAEKAPAELTLRLYAKGEFYFNKLAAEKLGDMKFVKVETQGKLVTLTPVAKAVEGATPIMYCHAAPVLRLAKVLAVTGWSQTTQDLAVKPVGAGSLQVVIA